MHMKVTDESVYYKTYNKTCVTCKDSNQPVHQPGMVSYELLVGGGEGRALN